MQVFTIIDELDIKRAVYRTETGVYQWMQLHPQYKEEGRDIKTDGPHTSTIVYVYNEDHTFLRRNRGLS